MTASLQVLKFRIFGDYGHFGMRYATTSSPTYMIPPRHTIAGIIGAMMGVRREEVSEIFNPPDCKIGLSVDRPLSVVKIPLKRLKIKTRSMTSFLSVTEHNIVPYLMLRNPSYTILFHHKDQEVMGRLRELLERHEFVYPPALGMAKLLADVEYLGIEEVVPITDEREISTRCAFPADHLQVIPEDENELVIERFALRLDKDRRGCAFHNVMVDVRGTPITGNWNPNRLATAMERRGEEETYVLW